MEEKIEKLLKEPIETLGYELYDVIYEKQAKDYYLRIFIDTPRGISLEDCEKVSNSISDLLDEVNDIKEPYYLEVSSPGVERLLRKNKHLEANLGKEITVKLFQPIGREQEIESTNKKTKKTNNKQIDGILKEFHQDDIVLMVNEQEVTIPRKDISMMRLKFNWE